MQRIAIIGSSGAGKSTLAKTLGEKLCLPVIHLDAYYWRAGWVETPSTEWIDREKQLLNGDRWIVDGNYGNSMKMRLDVATTIIWLDFNRILCLWRVINRYWQYKGKVRPDMALGCPEKLDLDFLQYVWNFPLIQRPKILARLAPYQNDKQIVILKNPRQLSNFLLHISNFLQSSN